MQDFQEKEYTRQFDWYLWKKIFKYVKNYRKETIGLITVMIIVGLIDAIFPYMNKYAIDNFVVTGQMDGLVGFAVSYGVLVLIQAVNVWFLIALAGKVETGMGYDIRKEGFEHLQELSLSYYDKTAVGWLMARMTSDVRRLGEVISWGMVDGVWGVAMMFFMMVLMFVIDYRLALISFSVIPVLFIISLYFQRRILKASRKVRKINSRITGSFNEGIMGAKTSKTLVREEDNLKEFSELTGNMRSSSIRAAVLSSLYLPVVLTLASIGTALALYYGGRGVLLQSLQYGTLVLFIQNTTLFFEPVFQLARVFTELQFAQASAERTMSMIDTEVEIKDRREVVELYGDKYNPRRENWSGIKGDITFKNVWFSYGGEEQVLEDFNLEVKAGETIALVGETGSGKTTIVNLLCRFYEPEKGKVLIDGVDYRQRSQLWLHENIGFVLQDPHLFSGTIRENIRYGRLEADDREIEEAAKLVNAHSFIMKMENAYNTVLGEGGGMLSTGEKQLISFARAVLSDPRIFVLDEATSSIDTEMEQLIQKAITRILQGRTNFIIAHRLSTIRSADRILVIRDGEITEEGKHRELLQAGGYYYSLYTQQFMEEEERVV
ncbi:MAG TPA: ABC transporter ATP-binding protein [Halanaerobiales bacterium]|nr:ABC transporter ATP-binding protein [Halanaerobiales bacterium]